MLAGFSVFRDLVPPLHFWSFLETASLCLHLSLSALSEQAANRLLRLLRLQLSFLYQPGDFLA